MIRSKSFKFICLVVSFVCISAILATLPMALKMTNNEITGIFVSNMNNKEAYGINSDFYMSRSFDNDLIGYLTELSSSSVVDLKGDNYDGETKAYYKEKKKLSEQALKHIKNADYFVINNDTNQINTNTEYKTAKEFEKNVDGECYVKISSKNDNISYYKKLNKHEYYTNRINSEFGSYMDIPNCDVYVSIHKDFYNNSEYYDMISSKREQFEENIFFIEIIGIGIIICAILGGISIFLYKINKSILFDKDSFWLKLSKFIPLELYLLALFSTTIFFFTGFEFSIYGTFISSFLSIGFLFTVIYIFNKQINSYEDKTDFFKNTFVYKIFRFIKISFKNTLMLTRSMPLSRRIIGLAIICIIFNIFMMILAMDGYNILIAIIASVMTIGTLTYYVLKKLWYLSYIMNGTQRIKNGDVHYKLKLIGEDNFTTLADNINNIRDGLDKAIDSQLKSERMKSELITNVSHDLKTPLTSIINYVELIKKEDNITPEYINDYINVLDSKSKRLKVLIEDLFEASKASSGNIELNMGKIDLTQLMRQSIGEMEEKLSEANLDLKINVPEERIYIRADGRRLYRVLENLLSNISKYSLPNTRVYIDITKDENSVKLTMKNISSYELNFDPGEIMERFKRADDSRNTEGSGLGLSIAKDLVKLQGGSFDIDIDGDLFKAIVKFNLYK